MAKVHEEVIVIKLSKLLKDRETVPNGSLVDAGLIENLEAVVQELVEAGVTVEAEKA